MDSSRLKKLSATLAARVFEEGEVLCQKGEVSPPFCIVKEGSLVLTDAEVGSTKVDSRNIGPGDHFGEEYLISGVPCPGNIRATSKGVAYYINRETFEKIFGGLNKLVLASVEKRKLVCVPRCRHYFQSADI